tara:strand:+ start:52 stop:270 length:219 start_codon:yes stop_codon:yes gene_type:complete
MPGKSDKPQKGNVVESSYMMKKDKSSYMMKDKKDFKPHKMYCKDGTVHNAKTYKQHLSLKNKGCGHKPMKKK